MYYIIIIIIIIIIKLYFRPQPIDKTMELGLRHGQIYTIDSKMSVISVKNPEKRFRDYG